MIVRPFPVFEHYWDPNTVITLADDQDGTLVVNLLVFLCFTPVCYKAKVITALKVENDGGQKSCKGVLNRTDLGKGC